MNNKVDPQARVSFRDFLRGELKGLEFYQRRGDHYLIREFAKYCAEKGAPIDEASLGRYLRDVEPVLPTPERCRALARVLILPSLRVLGEAGYLTPADVSPDIPGTLTPAQLAELVTDAALIAWRMPGADLRAIAETLKEKGKAGQA